MYPEAFLLRAQAVGLEAWEMHNLGHRMAEYFDPDQQRWKWIDTSIRAQIANPDGELVNAWQLWKRLPWEGLNFVDLPPETPNTRVFAGFLSSANPILYWNRGVNFQEQERLGLPCELV